MEVGESESHWDLNTEEYAFSVDVKKHEQQDVFSGCSSSILPHQDMMDVDNKSAPTKLNVIYFKDEVEKENYLNWAKSLGDFAYKPNFIFSEDDKIFGIGKPAGTLITKWILDRSREIWEYDQSGSYSRVGKDWRKVGRWLGNAMYKVHKTGNFVGNIMESTYVDEELERVVFIKNNKIMYHSMGIEMGIQGDLMNLNDFVDWVQNSKPVGNNIMTNQMFDIILFKELYAQIMSKPASTLQELQFASFFLCHSPLYWDWKERRSFCFTYDSVRQNQRTQFDTSMSYDVKSKTFIDDNWHNQLSSMNRLFLIVYNNISKSSWFFRCPMRYNLITFHRNCFEHINDQIMVVSKLLSEEEIDLMLFKVYPDAIHKAYLEFYNSNMLSLEVKINLLSGGYRLS